MFGDISLGPAIGIFLAAALVVGVVGTYMTRLVDGIADRTGFGEALTGAVLLGASTSLPGIVTSVWSAGAGHVDLAASNAVGGIAAQTAFLVFADMIYRRANLEHAAASATNLTQLAFLILLLTLPLLARIAPPVTVLGVHPVSVLLFLIYLAGVRSAAGTESRPMWRPKKTSETRTDTPDPDVLSGRSSVQVFALFAASALTVAVAGWLIALSGVSIAQQGGLSQSLVGALMTAVATSIPELVTTIAAVRRGALQLAMGGIIGGNAFDILFLAFSDGTYRSGSLYHEMNEDAVFWVIVSLLMSAILMLGLLKRERHGIANIGFESCLLLIVYAGAVALQIA